MKNSERIRNMRISFRCRTNKNFVRINTAIFQLPNGTKLTVDRDTTEYTLSANGVLNMYWRDCYLWALNDQNIFESEDGHGFYPSDYAAEEFARLVIGATVSFDLEEDPIENDPSPEEKYEVIVQSFAIE